MKKNLISAILAGIMISISSIAYLNTNQILGAFIFSIGLLSVLHLDLSLFTGKVPYITTCKELPYLITILIGNIIGCCIMFAFPSNVALIIMQKNLNISLLTIFIRSMLCNIIIYVAVECYKKKDILSVILLIVVFIISGFDHCIARICFIISARLFTIDIFIYLLVVILGNVAGGVLFHKLKEKTYK